MFLKSFNIHHCIFFFFVLPCVLTSCHTRQNNSASNPTDKTYHRKDSLIKQVQSLNKKGTIARDNSHYKSAFNTHYEAYRLAKEINDTSGQIFALNNIGTDLRRTSSNSEASSYHFAALELAGKNAMYLKSRAVAMNGLGNIFLSLNKADQAQTYFKQSLQIEKQLESNLGQAINYANIAESFRMKNLIDSALYYYNQSLFQNQLIKSDIGIAICKKSIGSIYLYQGKTQTGLRLMQEAVKLMSNSKDIFHKNEMEIALCKAYLDENRLEDAKPLLNDILQSSNQISSYDQLFTSYEMLAKLQEKSYNFLDAFQANKKMQAYRDSILQQNNEVRILELENRYLSKQASQQIRLLTAEKALAEKTKTEQNRILILVIFVLAVLASIFYYRYRNRRHISMELTKINDMKSQFFTNISHEFRTPLTLIKAPIENLIENNKSEKTGEELRIVLRNTNQMLFLVQQLLNISKLESGKFSIQVQPNDLAENIRVIANSFDYFATKKQIDYQQYITPSGIVWFDANIVEIIIINLLSNAMKFTPEKGSVKLDTSYNTGLYFISLENDIEKELSEEELKHIFDRFYTTAKKPEIGTGVGLSLVKEICTLYRAKINLVYENKQIKFTIELPVDKSHFTENEISIDEQNNTSVFLKPMKEKKETKEPEKNEAPILLVVEDNDDMCYFLQKVFQKHYRVVISKDGEDGIRKAKELIPDVIVSDVMMPKINGLALCKTLKSDYFTNHIPIILLSALNEQDNIVKGLECKADDYIVKPFNSKILLTKIKNQLEHRDILIKKYRDELEQKPLDVVLKQNEKSFTFLLNRVAEVITNPDFGVDEFCNICSMSRTQLHRKIKATTGLSTTAYIRFHRIKIASKLLKEPDLSISDVCFASGFNDASYFSRCFKEEMKLSPVDYRKQFLN